MIIVHIIDTRSFAVPDENTVSAYRLEKSRRFKNEKDRLLSLAASKALDFALHDFGCRERDMAYRVSDKGRPFFEGSPLHFSISHSGVYAAAAVSENVIGIDVQELVPCNMKVAARCFSDAEIRQLEESASPGIDFTKIWTARESAAKLKGTGLAAIKDDISPLHIQTFQLENAYLSVCTFEEETIKLCQNA